MYKLRSSRDCTNWEMYKLRKVQTENLERSYDQVDFRCKTDSGSYIPTVREKIRLREGREAFLAKEKREKHKDVGTKAGI